MASDSLLNERVDFFYNDFAGQIDTFGNSAMSGCYYGPKGDFIRRQGWGSGYTYTSTDPKKAGTDFAVLAFGEIADEDGTKLGPFGNTWLGGKQGIKSLLPTSTIKNTFVLRRPRKSTLKLQEKWDDQKSMLYQRRFNEQKEDEANGKVYGYKDCILENIGDQSETMFICHFAKMYKATTTQTRNENEEKLTMRSSEKRRRQDVVQPNAIKSPLHAERPPPPYTIGALYNPYVQDGYGGPLVEKHNSLLVQQEIYDIDNNLVPQWEVRQALKPGTVVLATLVPTMYVMNDINDKRKTQKTEKKIFHLVVKTVRIVAESDFSLAPLSIQSRPLDEDDPSQNNTTIESVNRALADVRVMKRPKLKEGPKKTDDFDDEMDSDDDF